MNNYKVTVLMSLYNTPREQLKASIDSILNQTYKDFELLIIDDGSTEECLKVLGEYEDERIRIIHNEKNMGLVKSLNRGLEQSHTDYIIRMDTDDIAYEDRIEKQIKFVEEHPEYSIVSGRADIFDEKGIYGTTMQRGKMTKEDMLFGTPFVHPTIILKRKDVMQCGGYPEYRRCEDYAMEMNLYANGYKGYIMDDVLIKYRMDQNGYKKKKFRDRFIEAKARWIYFRKMKVKFYQYIYVIKPILVGMMPKCLYKQIQKAKFKKVNENG